MLVQLGQDHLKRFSLKGVFAPSVRRFIHNDDTLCVALSACQRRGETLCITLAAIPEIKSLVTAVYRLKKRDNFTGF